MAKTRKQRQQAEMRRQEARRANATRGKVTLASSEWDHGATGPANRAGLVVEERGEMDPASGKVVNPNRVTGVRRIDMLDLYLKRGVISQRGHAAGEIIRRVWLRTGIGTCAPWLRERVDSSPKPDAAIDVQIERISALARVSSLIQPYDIQVIEAVCAHGAGVGVLAHYRGMNHREGLVHLSTALERLADAMERGA